MFLHDNVLWVGLSFRPDVAGLGIKAFGLRARVKCEMASADTLSPILFSCHHAADVVSVGRFGERVNTYRTHHSITMEGRHVEISGVLIGFGWLDWLVERFIIIQLFLSERPNGGQFFGTRLPNFD